jgi:hypothetical protein
MKDKEHAHRDSHFQGELDSLKLNMACITSILEKTLKNISGKGPSDWPATFAQIQATIQPG